MHLLTDGDTYIHITDHNHNALTWQTIKDWWWSSALPSPYKKRIWQSEVTIIPLWAYNGDVKLMGKKPATTTTPNTSERKQPDFIGFVNITLTDEELQFVDDADTDDTSMKNHLDYLLDIGKVSLNFNRGSMNATLTVMEGVSAGYAVSGYSDTLQEALIILRLKVQNYLDKFPEIYTNGGTKKRRG